MAPASASRCTPALRRFSIPPRHLADSDKDAPLLAGIVRVGRSLDQTLIAEGVEIEQQPTWPRDYRRDYAQGWPSSRPLGPRLIEQLLRELHPLGIGIAVFDDGDAQHETTGQQVMTEARLRLFVNDSSEQSRRAIEAIRSICEQELSGRYRLEIVDVMDDPDAARDARVMATPTLVKSLPPPLRQIIGDLSDKRRVLVELDILPSSPTPPSPTDAS